MMSFFKKSQKNQEQNKTPHQKWHEKRQYPRIDKNFVLTYFTKDNPHQKIEITQLKNISKGGMCFITSQSFAPKTELSIELKTPFISETTYLEGYTLESHQKAAGLIYETRLKFVNLNPHGEFLLDKLIEFINTQDKTENA